MASYRQNAYGSLHSDDRELQTRLNSYQRPNDGNAQGPAMGYQKNRTIEAVAGRQPIGAIQKPGFKQGPTYSLTNASGGTEQSEEKIPATEQPEAGPADNGYQQSDAVTRAQQMLEEHMAQKPGEYQSAWQNQLNDILNKILNREEFSYDINGDALYQQYKDQYMLQGQQAMMDTMGQAQAMTGGYGNSYAQSAGQQAYHGYLQQLNDKIPELYSLALDKYQMDGKTLADQYAMIGAREDQDYGRYRDTVSDYYSELDRITGNYRDERDYDYGRYADERDFSYGQERDQAADAKWEEEFGYQKDRDQASDEKWAEEFGYQKDRDKIQDEQWQKEFDEAKRRYDQEWEQEYGSGSGGSSGGSGGGSGGNVGGNSGGDATPTEPEQSEEPDAPEEANASTPNYDTIAATVNQYIKNGASQVEINAYLRSAYNAGYITYEQYVSLKNGYRPVDFGE